MHKEIYPLYAHEWSAYELVRLDQCAYDLVDYQGELIKKPTGMLVPRNTCLPWWLHRLCDGQHSHAHQWWPPQAVVEAQAGAKLTLPLGTYKALALIEELF